MPTKTGRPLKLNNQVMEDICTAISIGTPLSAAAVYGGISYSSFLNYYQAGEEEFKRLERLSDAGETQEPDKEKKIFLQFFHRVSKAKADAAVSWTQVLNNAAGVDPKYALEMLRKWYPETYGDTQRVEMTGAQGGPIETEDVTFDDGSRIERLVSLLERARERRSETPDDGD